MNQERWAQIIGEAADRIWGEVDGPLGRQSMEGLENRPLEIARAEAVLEPLRDLLTRAEVAESQLASLRSSVEEAIAYFIAQAEAADAEGQADAYRAASTHLRSLSGTKEAA